MQFSDSAHRSAVKTEAKIGNHNGLFSEVKDRAIRKTWGGLEVRMRRMTNVTQLR